jgi:hypothetical protein
MKSALSWDVMHRSLLANLPTFQDNPSVPSSEVKQSKEKLFFELLDF